MPIRSLAPLILLVSCARHAPAASLDASPVAASPATALPVATADCPEEADDPCEHLDRACDRAACREIWAPRERGLRVGASVLDEVCDAGDGPSCRLVGLRVLATGSWDEMEIGMDLLLKACRLGDEEACGALPPWLRTTDASFLDGATHACVDGSSDACVIAAITEAPGPVEADAALATLCASGNGSACAAREKAGDPVAALAEACVAKHPDACDGYADAVEARHEDGRAVLARACDAGVGAGCARMAFEETDVQATAHDLDLACALHLQAACDTRAELARRGGPPVP